MLFTSLLKSLNWIFRTYTALQNVYMRCFDSLFVQPDHLSVLLSGYTPTRQLRSSDCHLLSQPADNTVFASRAFSSAAPRIWNSLPLVPVRTAPSVSTFRRHLKTYLFSSTTATDKQIHPRLRFESCLTYGALQVLFTYLLSNSHFSDLSRNFYLLSVR